jgi:hypothetical protein
VTLRLEPKDSKDRRIRAGSLVRLIGVPDLSTMPLVTRRETLPVFEHVLGTCKRVQDFDRNGLAQLTFQIRKGRHTALHSIYVEPELLLLQKA